MAVPCAFSCAEVLRWVLLLWPGSLPIRFLSAHALWQSLMPSTGLAHTALQAGHSSPLEGPRPTGTFILTDTRSQGDHRTDGKAESVMVCGLCAIGKQNRELGISHQN